MNAKEVIKNNILIGMGTYLDSVTLQILGAVIAKALFGFEITTIDQLPATIDNTNEYVIDLYQLKNSGKLSKKTISYYLNTVREFIDFSHKPLTVAVENDVENYLYHKRQRGNSNASLNNLKRNLSAVFTWMRKNKLRPDNPTETIGNFAEECKPIDHLAPEEYEQLKTGCRYKRDRALLEFMRCTAARRGEVSGIRICDIDWHSGKIIINGKKTKTYRPVCIDSVAMKYIEDYLQERCVSLSSTEPLFTYVRGDRTKGLGEDGLYGAIKAIAKRAGMDRRVYPHLFRKTTATAIIKRGGSEETAGEYLGHKPRTVTGRHYSYKGEEHTLRIFQDYVAAI